MEKFFNTAGPVDCQRHYCLPPLERFDLDEVLLLIAQQKYFVLHAPWQTGKTSCLLALRNYLNAESRYACVYANIAGAQAARENVAGAMRAILSVLDHESSATLHDDFLKEHWVGIFEKSGEFEAFHAALAAWASQSAKPIVLLLDEVDALIGDTLIALLRQLRAGYANRPQAFPQSVILCGVRDVRDYGIHSSSESYVADLGLIKTRPSLRIANRIYREVIPRELTYGTQVSITHETEWYIDSDGRLNMSKLLTAFQDFFRKNIEHWSEHFQYKEAGPQLLLQAFLQRILNGGGRIEREYGLGRKRTDLLVVWPYPAGVQEVVIEMKILYGAFEATIQEGLAQTWTYMDTCGTDEGHLLIFDRHSEHAWDDKIFCRPAAYQGHPITVWGCSPLKMC